MKENKIKTVVMISLIGNILLTTIKLLFGYVGNSESLVSDGFNSFADIIVSILLVIVIKISHKKADKNHPYGHEKFEGVMYLFLSLMILLTAILLGYSGISSLIEHISNPGSKVSPEIYTIYASAAALILKIGLFSLNYYTAKKYRSYSLAADAKNHLFDILATLVTVISIFLALQGFIYFEAIASIVIALLVLYTSVTMIKEALSFLVDEAPEESIVKDIKKEIILCEGVLRIDDFKSRKHMDKLYVDVEIAVNTNLNIKDAHAIAERVHHRIEEVFDVVHCMVHVNPYEH